MDEVRGLEVESHQPLIDLAVHDGSSFGEEQRRGPIVPPALHREREGRARETGVEPDRTGSSHQSEHDLGRRARHLRTRPLGGLIDPAAGDVRGLVADHVVIAGW